ERGEGDLPAGRASLSVAGLGHQRKIPDGIGRIHCSVLRQPPLRRPMRRSGCCSIDMDYFAPCGGEGDGAGAVGAAGVTIRGEVEPEPVVLGAFAGALLLVAVGDEPLLAVLLLLFQPAMIRKPIRSRTATPAIQPHIPPAALSSRRSTGSLKRGSVMTFLLPFGRIPRMEETRRARLRFL